MTTSRRDLSEAVVSFFVISTAVAALYLSWSQVQVSREHNRLSTQPLLNVYPTTDESDDEAGEDELGVYVENKGLGPALVKSVVYFLDKKQYVPRGQAAALEEIGDLAKSSGIVKYRKTEEIAPGNYIKEGNTIDLLTAETKNVLKRDQWAAFLENRFGVAIRYCSIYDICKTHCYNASKEYLDKECR